MRWKEVDATYIRGGAEIEMCNCLGIWLRDIQKNETGCFETRNVDVSQANEFFTSLSF